ncbi:hypothetical protein [Nocardia carnea]|uniref:hypothetical protein n=1 Tax=Nocardia carnea TaxID=37328 RepID=UPI0024581F90|nr:hypothetical protein [Nocardia carnea]
MAQLTVHNEHVHVDLAWWERIFAGRRRRFVIPLTAVDAAERVERPTRFSAAPGGRAGVVVTGVVKIGRWGLGTGTSRFLSVRRWVPAIRIVVSEDFAGELGYHELLISTSRADSVLEAVAAGNRS